MKMTEQEWIRERLEQAAGEARSRDEKAKKVIAAAIAINAGLGVVPFGINVWTFVGVTSAAVAMVGSIYGYHYSNEDAARLLRQIMVAAGSSTAMFALGLKFFAEVMKGAGVITMGGATAAGMALDAALAGAVTYAIGFTAKTYFEQGRKLDEAALRAEFKRRLREGKAQARRGQAA
jgi:uncharacterized protein (DUF697 family)